MTTIKNIKVNLQNVLQLLLSIFVIIYWPTSFLIKNSIHDFALFFAPCFLIIAAIFLYSKNRYWFFPLIILPVTNPVLVILPLIIGLTLFIRDYKNKLVWVFLFLSLMMNIFYFKDFYQKSVFINDHLERQIVMQKSGLYPNFVLSRLFQNKFTSNLNDYRDNFFILVDPNNYFFSMHPREESTSQNLNKFPYLTLLFFLIGIYSIFNSDKKRILLILTIAGIFGLSFIKSINLVDSLLYVPLTLILLTGIWKNNFRSAFQGIFVNVAWVFIILFTSIDYLKLIFIQ